MSLRFMPRLKQRMAARRVAAVALLCLACTALYAATPFSGDNGSHGWQITTWIGQGLRYGLPALGLFATVAALGFERLSLFHPSMILTPENRYGFSQAVTLAVWPKLTPLLGGSLRKLRGIPVAQLGAAMARNVATAGAGEETLEWDAIVKLAARAPG